ncbi:MAG: AIR synthase-related protein, partial [Pseudomonadota bacterium]
EVMGQIVKAIEGMAEACKTLDFPVVSGNVSLYNETDGVGIPPTPVVGGVGLIEDVTKIYTLKGAQPGDVLILIGETTGHLGASLYAREILGLDGEEAGPPPPVDLEVEKRNADFVRSLIEQGLVNAVHDVSDGGIACAVAEMALASGVGFEFREDDDMPLDILFGEQQGRFLIASSPIKFEPAKIQEEAKATGAIRATRIGNFDGDRIKLASGKTTPLSRLREAHEDWLPSFMNTVD